MFLKYASIMGLSIELQYKYDKYLKNNIEKYEIPFRPEHIDYQIKVVYTNQINASDYKDFEVFSKTKDGDVKSGIAIDQQLYQILILNHTFEEEDETEYIYMGVAFLKIALHEKMFPLHASTILYKNEAICFSGPSQTGKSTHTSQWEKYIKNAVKLNDDKTMLTLENKDIYAHGIPFSGSKSININKKAKLKAIIFLKQSKVNIIKRMKPEVATIELARNIYQPTDGQAWQFIFSQIEKIINQIPIYQLSCDISEEAVNKAYGAIYRGEVDEN